MEKNCWNHKENTDKSAHGTIKPITNVKRENFWGQEYFIYSKREYLDTGKPIEAFKKHNHWNIFFSNVSPYNQAVSEKYEGVLSALR